MALQDILQKILQEAQKQVAEVEKEFDTATAQLKEESKNIEAGEKSDLDDRKKKALEKLFLETETMANRENKKVLLLSKNTLINDSLVGLVEHLSGLADKEYSEILTKMFERLDIDGGDVFAPSTKVSLVESIAPKGFTVKADDSVLSGFVFRSNGVEIDNTFENLVNSELRSDVEAFFAQKLELV